MGIGNFFISFFEESEEEIQEEINEAKKQQEEAEKRLKELRERKKQRAKAKKKGGFKKFWKKRRNQVKSVFKNILIIIGIVLVVWVVSLGVQKYKEMPRPYVYRCSEPNLCSDCLVAASCIDFEDSTDEIYVHVRIDNKNDVQGDCKAQMIVEQEGDTLIDKEVELGVLEAQEKKVFKIGLDIPSGDSKITVDPSCNWE